MSQFFDNLRSKAFNLFSYALYGKPNKQWVTQSATRFIGPVGIGNFLANIYIWREEVYRPTMRAYVAAEWAECRFQLIGTNLQMAAHVFNEVWESQYRVGSIDEAVDLLTEELRAWLPKDVAEPPEQADPNLTSLYGEGGELRLTVELDEDSDGENYEEED